MYSLIEDRALKTNKGITLISLVVTIIILLILAGISIGMLSGDNSILRQAGNAKTQTDIAEEKEILQTSALSAMGKSKYGEVTKEKLDNELDKNIGSTNYSSESADDGISVTFTNSRRICIVDNDGNVTEYKPILATGIEVDKATDSVGVDDTITLTATVTPQNSSATITWVLVEGGSYGTLNTSTGEVTGTQQGADKVKIKAKAINPDGTEVESSNTCTITITASPFIDYSYVQYDVEYTDAYRGSYNKNTGWRLLTSDATLASRYAGAVNAGTAGAEATYEGNIEIISTGIPAKLYYSKYSVSSKKFDGNIYSSTETESTKHPYMKSGGTAGYWYGNDTQRTKYLADYTFASRTTSDSNIYAASGLMYNFRNIGFDTTNDTLSDSTITAHYGGFKAISVNGVAQTASTSNVIIADTLFKPSIASGTVDGMRSLSLLDVKGSNNDSTDVSTAVSDPTGRTGLYVLKNYTPNTYTGGEQCWLASPVGVNALQIRNLSSQGTINQNHTTAFGVRPVITITGVKMKREAGSHVWKIVETLE